MFAVADRSCRFLLAWQDCDPRSVDSEGVQEWTAGDQHSSSDVDGCWNGAVGDGMVDCARVQAEEGGDLGAVEDLSIWYGQQPRS